MKSSSQISKEVKAELRNEFPEYKWSVRKESFSGGFSINVTIVSGPENPIATGETYAQLGKVIEDYFSGKYSSNGYELTNNGKELIERVWEIINKDNYNNSDHMTDYFSVGYYTHLDLGKRNKPFEVK